MLGSAGEPVGSSIMSGGIGEDDKGDGGCGGVGVGEFYEGDRSTGGNRWPKQETLALLKIRSDMDAVFRDSTLKGPLWEDISRKLGELGYHRGAKKCKEKFENVYKYHKRTKDGRVGKSDGKTYRFFEELQALEQLNPSSSSSFPQPQPETVQAAVPVSMVIPAGTNPAGITVTSSVVTPITAQPHVTRVIQQHEESPVPIYYSSPSATPSSSSLSGSDDEDEVVGTRSRSRKRKWKEFFERLTKEVVDKQEELQKKFLEAVEKRERDRLARDEAWRTQETNRLNREHDVLVHERSMAAAKDAALMSFLQKLSIDPRIVQCPNVVVGNATRVTEPSQPLPVKSREIHVVLPEQILIQSPPQPQPQPQSQASAPVLVNMDNRQTSKGGGESNDQLEASSSRWPKAEVEALISLRTQLDEKYQESGPKGPLWEEVSASMKKLGYNRNSKRCKEKWENINKYFKKVKESNKRRPEDSKTCPYFHQLDALYRGKTPRLDNVTTFSPTNAPRVENLNTVARPEPQWEGGNDSGDDEDNDYDDDDGEEGSGGYEIVANNSNNNDNDNDNNNSGNDGINSMTASTTPVSLT
ncbi:hypothetical protein KSS87_001282 [Heliosperma pusillum]|nr:hypothetical protein KSS87_001282 [Heliosperma pusillum]